MKGTDTYAWRLERFVISCREWSLQIRDVFSVRYVLSQQQTFGQTDRYKLFGVFTVKDGRGRVWETGQDYTVSGFTVCSFRQAVMNCWIAQICVFVIHLFVYNIFICWFILLICYICTAACVILDVVAETEVVASRVSLAELHIL